MDRSICLHSAIRNGSSMEYLEHLIARYPQSLSSRSMVRGSYPLHTAIETAESPDEAIDLVDLILRHDPLAAQRHRTDGTLPLHVAAASNVDHIEATDLLLSAYPQALERKSMDGLTPLAVAIGHDNAKLVELFLGTAKNPCILCSPSLLTLCLSPLGKNGTRGRATGIAKLTIMQCLISANRHLGYTKDTETNLYPLHRALVTQQDADLVNYLLQCFPAALKKSVNGQFPIHLAITAACSIQVVETLLSFDPGLAKQTTEEDSIFGCCTALALALNVISIDSDVKELPIHCNLRLIALLISKDPDALMRPLRDGTLLFHRCLSNTHCSLKVVRFLLSEYPDVAWHCDKQGRLPLHALVSGRAIEKSSLVQLLLDVYPDAIMTKDSLGQLPIHSCVASPNGIHCLNVVSMLGRYNPHTLMVADQKGNFPLHLACMRKENSLLRCVELLVRMCPQAAKEASPDGIPIVVAASCSSLDVIFFLTKLSPELFARTNDVER